MKMKKTLNNVNNQFSYYCSKGAQIRCSLFVFHMKCWIFVKILHFS